jgi:3,4-dihydroxy 2-butanone 4-phosphate synthase/GTP cyclohydrolase II
MALWCGNPDAQPTLVRVQAAPPSWGLFSPDRSRLSGQARDALAAIRREHRGACVFMHLDGRGPEWIERQFGIDMRGENEPGALARADALRDLGTGCQILLDLGCRDLVLLTNSQRPIVGVEAYGLRIVERVPLVGVRG